MPLIKTSCSRNVAQTPPRPRRWSQTPPRRWQPAAAHRPACSCSAVWPPLPQPGLGPRRTACPGASAAPAGSRWAGWWSGCPCCPPPGRAPPSGWPWPGESAWSWAGGRSQGAAWPGCGSRRVGRGHHRLPRGWGGGRGGRGWLEGREGRGARRGRAGSSGGTRYKRHAGTPASVGICCTGCTPGSRWDTLHPRAPQGWCRGQLLLQPGPPDRELGQLPLSWVDGSGAQWCQDANCGWIFNRRR